MGGAAMQLGWFGKNKQRLSLDILPLKKIVAVSDQYWAALYQPMIDVVEKNFDVFSKQKEKLGVDYLDQFVKLVRRSKGAVQDDPLIVHIHTYSLVLAFSALHVARVVNDFEFHAISKGKKTKGNRNQFYPWLNVPEKSEIKLKKSSRVFPVYVKGLSILNTMITDVGWNWLHSRPDVLKPMLDAVYSNAESGSLSGLLAGMRAAPLENKVSSAVVEKVTEVNVESEPVSEGDEDGSQKLDSLIKNLGGDNKECSLEELLEAQKGDGEGQKPKVDSDKSEGGLDYSIFESGPTTEAEQDGQFTTEVTNEKKKPEKEEESDLKNNQPPSLNSADRVLNEFQALISNTKKMDEEEKMQPLEQNKSIENNEPEQGLFTTEATISGDLIKWCESIVNKKDRFSGVYVVEYEGRRCMALDKELGVLSFVKSDYDLESEEKYKAVAVEVLTDLMMSSEWIAREDGGDAWQCCINGEELSVILLKKECVADLTFQTIEIS